IDVRSDDPVWFEWSATWLDRRGDIGSMFINDIVFAELSVQVESEAEMEQTLAALKVTLARTPMQALFIAGKAYEQYRAAGGIRTGVLPDFLIGAHAKVMRWPLLTRDVRRFRTYFPDVELITPDT